MTPLIQSEFDDWAITSVRLFKVIEREKETKTTTNLTTRWWLPELDAAWRLEYMDRLLYYRQNPSLRSWQSYLDQLT